MSLPERTGLQRPGEAAQGVADKLIERGDDSRISLRRLLVPAVFFGLALLYILGGLTLRQVVESADYDDQFRVQSSRVIQIPAPRGCIYDRNGKLIVGNRPRYNIVADLSVLREEFQAEFKRVIPLAKFSRNREKRLRQIGELRSSSRCAVLQRYLDKVNRVLGHAEQVDPKDVARHIVAKRGLDFPLVTDIAPEEVARFVENFPEEYPLRLYIDSVRQYPNGDGDSAAHVLGYLGNTDDLGEDPDEDPELKNLRKLKYPGKTGVSGLELHCNEQLQGKPGSQVWMVNPNGYLFQKLSETKQEQGSHIFCSLDMDLQIAAEAALAEVKSDEIGQCKGCAIAIDIASGEILAMANYPRFNPNNFADKVSAAYYNAVKASGGLFNRATQGAYPPGSTFKIITGIAGMRAGKLDPDEQLECGSMYDIGGGNLRPEHDGQAFGLVDLPKMLRVSCNVYCYQMGLRMGIDPIAKEARRLGLDTRIPLEISTTGGLIVPDLRWAKAHGYSGWSNGDTTNTAIGQGYLKTTPLHIAAMISSVAANRTHTDLTLIHDPMRAETRLGHNAEPLDLTPYQRQRLVDGLRECVQSDERGSTGKPVRVPGLDIVGKTGTAEFKDEKTKKPVNLAWFSGFAPGDNPRIAVCVMIEGESGGPHLHGGKHAGPVAKAIFQKWLEQHAKIGERSADTPAVP